MPVITNSTRLTSQHWLCHKTGKVAYQVIFWLIVTAHLGLWIWWALRHAGN